MKKRIIWLVGLILFAFIGDRVGGLVLDRIAKKSQFRYSNLYFDRGEADILLIGNSRGLTFYQPYIEELTNQSTLNLSYNALPSYMASAMVLDYLDKYPAPKKIIYDITLMNGGNPPLMAGMAPYAGQSHRIDSLIYQVDKQSWYGGKISHLYRYNSEVFNRVLFYLKKSDKDWLLDRVITPEVIAEMEGFEVIPFDFTEVMMADLKRLYAAATAKGVDVQFVVSPYFPGYAQKIPNLMDLVNTVEQTIGQPVHDFKDAIDDPAYFGDYQHPNKAGSKVYIELLVAQGVL